MSGMITSYKSRNDVWPILSLAVAGSAILGSVLQGSYFVFEGRWTTYAIVAMAVAVTNLSLAFRFLATRSGRLLGLVLMLYLTQLGIMIVNFFDQEPPFAFRLLQVAIAVSYLATVMSVFLAGVRIVAPANAILLMCSVGIGIFISEMTLGFLAIPVSDTPTVPEWQGNVVEPHPSLGVVYRPHSVLKTYYPDNPRGYFKEETGIKREVWLYVEGRNVADLVSPLDTPDRVRIAIEKVETSTEHDIQLNIPLLKVQQNHPYEVNFRARTDSPRNIDVGFSMAHEPWSRLGLFKRIALRPEWQSFQEQFIATANEDNARIHFDVGGSDIPVEVSSVKLLSLSDNRFIEPDLPPKRYFVNYKFNALGCRGRDYTIPRPKGTTRILALGDSYTMGYGVHEEDNFPNQLERLLNEISGASGGGRTFEAISCGVSGYGTREERLFYQLFGAKYEPDLVLLTMVFNDDIAYTEEVQKGYVNRSPGKLELLFYSWGKIQDLRHRRPTPNFTKTVDEILRLNSEVRKRGARLVVIIFRMNPDFAGETDVGEIWNRLTDTVTKGLRDTGIPILELGKAFFEKYDYEDLAVHPLDGHPNEVAHTIAAREIRNFLQKNGLLK